ncbi:hypothetical protein U0355_12655 [Salimicrobium sp. PL1-032A]|uniref:hypothetical protein n=1 Tax=Salimicrobium sp. PL1-032A TaxID=3095364 RepID=UPI0032619F47
MKQKIWMTIAVLSIGTVFVGIGLMFYLYESFYVDNEKDSLFLQGGNLKEVYEEYGKIDTSKNA